MTTLSKCSWLLVLICTLVWMGCSSGQNNDHEGPNTADGTDGGSDGDGGIIFCQNDGNCPDNMECRGGVCEAVITCSCNYDCGVRSDQLTCNQGTNRCTSGSTTTDCDGNCQCYANETCSGSQCIPAAGDADICNSDQDCQPDQACIDQKCVPKTCLTRDDCGSSVCLVCINGQCATPPNFCQVLEDCCLGFHCNFGSCVKDDVGCKSDADCKDPEFPRCIEGDCLPQCVSYLDCEPGLECRDGHCVIPGCTPETCPLNTWCNPTGGIDGKGACEPGCDAETDCQDNQRCNLATHQCENDCCVDCLPDQYCDTNSCTCKPKCLGDSDCSLGFTCNQQTGECEPAGGQEGDPCTSDAGCASGLLCDMCTFCDPVGSNTCLYECSYTCPRTDLACNLRRLDGLKWMCLPKI